LRTAFIEQLIVEARRNPRIFLVVGDLGFSVVEPFAAEFPDRFLNAGVAEQNMTGVAAGLASEGFHVFTYSIANFPTFRCLEQIRNDIAYHALAVTIVAVGGGMAYGNLGYSHHAVQDYAVLRSLPQVLMAAPGDPLETSAAVEWLAAHPQPSYLRLGKAGEPTLHSARPALTPGRLVPVFGEAQAGTFVTTGATLRHAMEAARHPDLAGRWAVRSLPLWAECCKADVACELERFPAIIAVEDHLAAGGFGSYLREAVGAKPDTQARLHTIALRPAACGMVGRQDSLNAAGGLTVHALMEAATGGGRSPAG
jgi:transketolase